jgi:hypothetical protein
MVKAQRRMRSGRRQLRKREKPEDKEGMVCEENCKEIRSVRADGKECLGESEER